MSAVCLHLLLLLVVVGCACVLLLQLVVGCACVLLLQLPYTPYTWAPLT